MFLIFHPFSFKSLERLRIRQELFYLKILFHISNLLWNLYLQSSAATMSISSMYLDFLSKPETRTLKAGNMRLKRTFKEVVTKGRVSYAESPVVEFVAVIVRRHNVQE